MTIDERLDRLTERHEALTQSVELLARSALAEDTKLSRLEDFMDRLVRIVEIHERRILDLRAGSNNFF
mgnify:CR=1 FL=1